MNVLITGGAGFIGSHLAHKALQQGCNVTILDNFSPQIHGQSPNSFNLTGARMIHGDVRNRESWIEALRDQDVVVHLAAETGTGQSMYQIHHYEQVNIGGTALLFDLLVNDQHHHIRRVVVASSRAIYGEGKYRCAEHGIVYPAMRRRADLINQRFEPLCPVCQSECEAIATDEASLIHPSSYYGLTKQIQEQTTLLFSQTLGIQAFALRYQNVYGPGQSLKNPYTGILAVFANLARANQPINIFEDGQESRDFVYIDDVVEATWKCVLAEPTGQSSAMALNIGSAERTTVMQVAQSIVDFFGSTSPIQITGDFREGDIRHNFADLQLAERNIAFKPSWKFTDGIRNFLMWAVSQEAGDTGDYLQSLAELRARGLMK